MKTAITDIPGIGPSSGKILVKNGFKTLEGIAGTAVEKLAEVPGFGELRARHVIKAANDLLAASLAGSAKLAKTEIRRGQKTTKKVARDKSNEKKKGKLKQAKLKQEKLRKEKLRKEKLRKEKLRKEKLRKEKLRKEKQRKEKQRKENLKKEKLRKEKLKKEKLRKEKQRKEKLKKEKSRKKKPSHRHKK